VAAELDAEEASQPNPPGEMLRNTETLRPRRPDPDNVRVARAHGAEETDPVADREGLRWRAPRDAGRLPIR